jgi:NADPH2:quinone reductase
LGQEGAGVVTAVGAEAKSVKVGDRVAYRAAGVLCGVRCRTGGPLGADAADFETETKRLTGGKGVDAVYDSVGKTTFGKGLDILRPRGMMVLFGGSSGAVPPFDLVALSQKGSLYMTRPMLANYIATREELVARSGAVFGMIAAGKLKLCIEHTYPLAEAQRAHRDLEGRKTTGKLLLIP